MSSVSSQQPRYSHPWYYYVGVGLYHVAVIVGVVVFYLTVTHPKRAEEARFAALEAKQSQLEVAQSEAQSNLQHRHLDAQVKLTEHKEQQTRTPVIQLTPRITQSISCEDIREIRLRLLLNNLGDAEVRIKQVKVKVANGAPNGNARDDLFLTQRFHYRRLLNPDSAATPPASTYFEPSPAPASAIAQVKLDPSPGLDTPEPVVQLTENDPLNNLPPHECRHGKIFAISSNSPDIDWKPLDKADQTFDTEETLGPKQNAQHEFVFVVTEYPEQHHRQWFRFQIQVAHGSSETASREQLQQVDLIVPGLPLPCCPDTTEPVAYKTTTCNNCPSVWEAEAPPLPTHVNFAPPTSAILDRSAPRKFVPPSVNTIRPVAPPSRK